MNKKIMVYMLVITLMITMIPFSPFAPEIASAEWENHKMHFPQLPDPNGWDIYHETNYIADDWQCSESGDIISISFWGSWHNDVVGDNDGFEIRIYSDLPAEQNPMGYSTPDESLWFRNIDLADVTITPEEPSSQGIIMIPEDGVLFHEVDNHVNYFRYDIDFSSVNPFHQEEGTTYWLGIIPDLWNGEWGWKTSLSHWNNTATYRFSTGPPAVKWHELLDPITSDPLDLAFVIMGEAVDEPVFINPAPMDDSVFFNTDSTEPSDWNVSENGSLQEEWSVFPADDYLMWNQSNATNQLQWWSGGDTIVFNDSNSDGGYSFLMANNSQSNRSQSLLWTYVNSTNVNSEDVYCGPIFINTSNGNSTMILYGNNSTYVLNRAFIGGKWGLYNTEDFSGQVTAPSDAINYWTEDWGELNLTTEGIFIKTIYNTYCGRIQSKFWNSNYTLMQEPATNWGWVVDQQFENATTDNATFFGIAVWNPLAALVNVSFDYINYWRLNYSLNHSATISWDTEVHSRPRMEFPVINLNNVTTDLFDFLLPHYTSWWGDECGGIQGNITNDTLTLWIRNLTNNMSMESRPFDTLNDASNYNQNDTVYYYTATLTNFTDWYIDWYNSQPSECYCTYPDEDEFANNYLMIYVQNCEDGENDDSDTLYDYTCAGIDVDNNRIWNDNDRFFAVTPFGEIASWTGTSPDMEIRISDEGYLYVNLSDAFCFIWESNDNAVHNIHRYKKHVHTLFMIPLWGLVKQNGKELDNSDVFGLHVATYNDADYPQSICVWENWNETACSVFHSEADADTIANMYWNQSYDFMEDYWSKGMMMCFYQGEDDCDDIFWYNQTLAEQCYEERWAECIEEYNSMNITEDNLKLWGEGSIPRSPKVNDTQGRFDINISIDINISYFNETEGSENQTVNVTFDVCNDGDMTLTNITLNLTWLNCSCSDWKFWFISSNITNDNITFYNDSCYVIFILSNLTGHNCSDYWISFNISECVVDTYGEIWITANVSTDSGIGDSDEDTVRIIWGVEGDYLRITGEQSTTDILSISETVLFFTALCIILGALLGLIVIVKLYGKL